MDRFEHHAVCAGRTTLSKNGTRTYSCRGRLNSYFEHHRDGAVVGRTARSPFVRNGMNASLDEHFFCWKTAPREASSALSTHGAFATAAVVTSFFSFQNTNETRRTRGVQSIFCILLFTSTKQQRAGGFTVGGGGVPSYLRWVFVSCFRLFLLFSSLCCLCL